MNNEALVLEIDRLHDAHTEGEIALMLNEKGMRSGTGNSVRQITLFNV
jgi:hypothetical protein